MRKIHFFAISIVISILSCTGYGFSVRYLQIGPNPLLQSTHKLHINYEITDEETHTAQYFLYSVRGELLQRSDQFSKTKMGDHQYTIFENAALQSLPKQLYILIGVFNSAGKTERKRAYVIIK
jgi:hypothetical protein